MPGCDASILGMGHQMKHCQVILLGEVQELLAYRMQTSWAIMMWSSPGEWDYRSGLSKWQYDVNLLLTHFWGLWSGFLTAI